MDQPVNVAEPFLVLAWFGAAALLYAGLSWIRLYKRIARLRSRGGGIDTEALEEPALFTGLGLVGAVVGLGLHFLV